jgi:L-histidine Nalpha-methyltransferase
VSTIAPDTRAVFAAEIAASLQQRPRELPSKYFYDALGTALFEAICRLPWYRITRAESALLAAHAREILSPFGGAFDVAELGSGSGDKLATLIGEANASPHSIHLIDISSAALEMAHDAVAPLARDAVVLHTATYEEGLSRLRAQRSQAPLLVLFLGSNIGNFDPGPAAALLRAIAGVLRPGDALLLGSDLTKPTRELLLAYDDPLRVTAAFNLNLLRRINDELGGTFELAGFTHRAHWHAEYQRVEMHLVSARAQRVRIAAAGIEAAFEPGEYIWTESSYKYEPDQIVAAGAAAGFATATQWLDPAARFALTRFTV